jgi:hypothetical protein
MIKYLKISSSINNPISYVTLQNYSGARIDVDIYSYFYPSDCNALGFD